MTKFNVINKEKLNPLELMQVCESLMKKNVESATIRQGNGCIWVTRGSIHDYYVFKDCKLIAVHGD